MAPRQSAKVVTKKAISKKASPKSSGNQLKYNLKRLHLAEVDRAPGLSQFEIDADLRLIEEVVSYNDSSVDFWQQKIAKEGESSIVAGKELAKLSWEEWKKYNKATSKQRADARNKEVREEGWKRKAASSSPMPPMENELEGIPDNIKLGCISEWVPESIPEDYKVHGSDIRPEIAPHTNSESDFDPEHFENPFPERTCLEDEVAVLSQVVKFEGALSRDPLHGFKVLHSAIFLILSMTWLSSTSTSDHFLRRTNGAVAWIAR